MAGLPESSDPSVVLTSRDLLIALTDATITFDRRGRPVSVVETVLVNQARATWIDLAPAVFLDADADELEKRPVSSRTRIKDFTNTVAKLELAALPAASRRPAARRRC